ncbi:MAG: COG1470 family protein [Promethearchaeota archaeon]
MNKSHNRIRAIILLSIISISIIGVGFAFIGTTQAKSGETKTPNSADSYNYLDPSTIKDPLGQEVKQNHTLDLSRTINLDLLHPIDIALDVYDFKVISAEIPVDLALSLGMDFPLKAETSYDPYKVHQNSTFPYVVNITNDGCNPYATLGIDFSMDFNQLDFDFLGLGNLLSFTADWGKIEYKDSWNIPFYGVNTKLGNWISYDILDKYYSLDQILDLSLSDYGLKGGVGVNIQYNLYSYLTAKASVSSAYGSSTTNLRWDSLGENNVSVAVSNSATPGDIYTIEVGNWVYHIAQDVRFKIWADIDVSVIGLKLIDKTYDYSYTLNLGDLTFPERDDYTFLSKAEVLAGKYLQGVDATWSPLNFNWGAGGGQLNAFDYQIDIPGNAELQKWFDDMDIDAGIAASVDINFPFNEISYYNPRMVTPGSTFDYNLLMDSVGAGTPSIDWNFDGFIDLSNVSILDMKLDRYEFNSGGTLFSIKDLETPFGTSYCQMEITHLVKLDTASQMLNEYISDMLYGINPDIQFRAWAVLKLEGYMTGDVQIVGTPQIDSVTPLVWDEQFDTQTTRITIPASMTPGQKFNITFTNLVYHLKVTPGIKLGVSVLGGIIGFDHTFLIPGVDQYLQREFYAPDFSEQIAVKNLGFSLDSLSVSDPQVPNGDYSVHGSFVLHNIGTISDTYTINLITDDLPSGTSGTWNGNSFGTSTGSISNGSSLVINFNINLGANTHAQDYLKNMLKFQVVSDTNNQIIGTISSKLTILPDPSLVETNVIMESAVNITPGVDVIIPATIQNKGQVTVNYEISLSGAHATLLTNSTFQLAPGTSTTAEYKISVPAESSSTPGDYNVNLIVKQLGTGKPDLNVSLTYTVEPFILANMLINDSQAPELNVNLDDEDHYANIMFSLDNKGNTASNMTISIEGISDYEINSHAGPTSLTLSAGASQNVFLKVNTQSLKPGVNNFDVKVKADNELILNKQYTITLHEALVSIQPINGSNTYSDKPLHYMITVTKLGSPITSDTFILQINGLDPSAYSLDKPNTFTLLGKQAIIFDMTIMPEDITKVRPNVNGFSVSLYSSEYNTTDVLETAGVIMPAVYKFSIPMEKVISVDTSTTYTISFTITNQGNVADDFTIVISNIPDYIEYSINSTALVNGSSNKVHVERGQSVVINVTFSKFNEGRYKPVINVYNTKNELIGSVAGLFWRGLMYSPAFIISMIIVMIAAASSVILLTLYSKGIIFPASATRFNMKLQSFKNSISYKIEQFRINHSTLKNRRKQDKLVKSLDKKMQQAQKLSRSAFKKEKLEEEKPKKNKEITKDLIHDESFWSGEPAEDTEDFDFDD